MKKEASAMMQIRPSAIAWLCSVLAALAVTARAAPNGSAELPPPAAVADKADTKVDAPNAEPKSRKADSSDGRCDRCDGGSCVRRVCVAKRTEKEVSKVCWSYRCEDFCIPGPSIYCGEKCLHDACGCWTHPIWQPTCAEVRTKRVPVKTTVKRKVPNVEWKVEERCRECRVLCFGVGGDGSPPEAKEAPATPADSDSGPD